MSLQLADAIADSMSRADVFFRRVKTVMVGVLVALSLALSVGLRLEMDRADKAEAQVVQLQGDIRTAKEIAGIRAEAAQQALSVATAAATANHKQAVAYLQLPTPAPEDRCEAARVLVDEAIAKERQ